MIESDAPGHIVNTASMAGLIPVPLHASYKASKHALIGLSSTLEVELQSVRAPIGVSVVCPGSIRTAIIDDAIKRYEAKADPSPAAQQVLQELKAGVDAGMHARDAGEMIVDAIEQNRFWVFPNVEELFAPAEEEWSRIQRCRVGGPPEFQPEA
jgi:short-subunit dehydrogenase